MHHSDLTDAKLGCAYLRKTDLTAVTLKDAD
ncbi:pentapeptide repeat-containing protein [Streptomyces sp. NPDC013161]